MRSSGQPTNYVLTYQENFGKNVREAMQKKNYLKTLKMFAVLYLLEIIFAQIVLADVLVITKYKQNHFKFCQGIIEPSSFKIHISALTLVFG